MNIQLNTSFPIKSCGQVSFNQNNKKYTPQKIQSNPYSNIAFQDTNNYIKTFIKQIQETYHFNKFLNQKGKLTNEEYKDIIKNRPYILAQAYKKVESSNERMYSNPNDMAICTQALKEYFDKEFGKDSYTVICPGTSTAQIGEGLRYLGCDTVLMPVSNIFASCYLSGKEKENSNINKLKLVKYLDKSGINPYNEKNIIILDYVASGKSITEIKKMLEEYNNIPPDNIHKVSVIKCLGMLQENNETLNKDIISRIAGDMCNSVSEIYSDTMHFNMLKKHNITNKSDEEIFEIFNKYTKPLGKCFSLCQFNELDKLK